MIVWYHITAKHRGRTILHDIKSFDIRKPCKRLGDLWDLASDGAEIIIRPAFDPEAPINVEELFA